jgi:hypothetical protein
MVNGMDTQSYHEAEHSAGPCGATAIVNCSQRDKVFVARSSGRSPFVAS